jgi:hypothetical protein
MRDRLDVIHSNIIQRCTNPHNPAWYRYGGRGITVCEEWRKRKAFKQWAYSNGYEPYVTIDRIDNDGGYFPDNCRWVTQKQNSNNRSSTHLVTAFGQTHSLLEWSEILNISYNTLKKRVIDHNEQGEYLLRPSRREVVNV